MSPPAQILFSEPVPVLGCVPNALRGVEFINQRSSYHQPDIRAGEQRQVVVHLDPGLKDEAQGHHRQGDVVAPGLVGAHLVLAVRRTVHAELLLNVLQGPLDSLTKY